MTHRDSYIIRTSSSQSIPCPCLEKRSSSSKQETEIISLLSLFACALSCIRVFSFTVDLPNIKGEPELDVQESKITFKATAGA